MRVDVEREREREREGKKRGWGVREESWMLTPGQCIEFLHDVGIHDAHGPDKTPTGHGLARGESEEDRKGD